MTSSIKTVALAGANGNIGKPVLEELLNQGYTVTVLSRPNSTSTYSDNVKVARADFQNKAQLVEALKGQDAFISTVGPEGSAGGGLLGEAAVEAGVKRYIPAEFGADTLHNPEIRSMPFFAPKIASQTKLEEVIASSSGKTTWTHVYPNLFLEYCIQINVIANLKQKQITLWDGGDVPYSAAPLPAIAKATVNVFKHLDETKNRAVKISSITLTQKKFLAAAQKVLGAEGWDAKVKTTQSAKEESFAALKADPANFMGWLFGFLNRASFSKEGGGDHSEDNDNELLGTPQVSEDDLEETIKQCAEIE